MESILRIQKIDHKIKLKVICCTIEQRQLFNKITAWHVDKYVKPDIVSPATATSGVCLTKHFIVHNTKQVQS